MININEIERILKANISNDLLMVSDNMIQSTSLTYLLKNILDKTEVIIKEPKLNISNNELSVHGSCDVINIIDIKTNMIFKIENEDLIIYMRGNLPDLKNKLNIPAISWLSVNDIRFDFSVFPEAEKNNAIINATVHAGKFELPVKADLQNCFGTLFLEGDFSKIPIPSLSDLALIFGDQNLIAGLPSQINQMGGFSLKDVEVGIDLDKKSISSLSVAVEIQKQFDLIPQVLAIGNASLSLDLEYPADAARRAFSAAISGTIIADSVSIPVFLNINNQADWVLGGSFREVSLPGLSGLIRAVGGEDLATSLPTELDNLGKIALSSIDMRFNPAQKTLSSFYFSLGTEEPWKLPGISDFALKDLSLEMRISNPGNSQTRTINGYAGGVLEICGTEIYLHGEISDTFVLTSKIPKLSLSAIINQFMEGFSLPAGLPDLEFADLDLSITPKTGEFSFSGRSSTPWHIPLGFETAEISDVSLSLKRTVEAPTQQKKVSGEIKGTVKLGEASFDIDYKFPGDFVLQGRIAQMNLLGLTEQLLQGLGIPDDLPDLIFKDIDIFINPQKGEFNISGRSSSSWSLPLGSQGLQIADLFLQASRSASTDGASQVNGRISGMVTIAGTSVSVDMQLQKAGLVLSGNVDRLKFSSLVQDLCGNQSAQNTLMPPGVQALDIENLSIFLDVSQKTFSASCRSGLGEAEVMVKKVEAGWGFIFGLVPPQNWKFSAISQELQSLDAIKFQDTAVIISSTEDSAFSLTKVQTPRKNLKIIRGLNLFFGMDLSPVKADAILGKTSLEIYAAVGGKLSDLVLETNLAGDIRLSEGLILGGIIFRLKPNPSDFSLQLLCVLKATVSSNILEFTGAIIVGSTSARMAATMLGFWNQPFGFQGVAIANVALSLGITYTIPPIPTIGIAGSLEVGEFKGSAAVLIDAGAPTKSMVAVEFNRLYLIDVLKTFCNPSLGTAIPDDVASTVLNIGFEDSKVYIVPQPTQIGELKYEQGFKLASKMFFQGIRGYADLNIDYAKGIDVKGDVDVIDLGGVFILRGASGKPKAAMALSIMPKTNPIPMINLNGEVQLLGLSSSVDIRFSKEGFFFRMEGKIFNLFEASLEVKGDISKLQGIYLKAYMRNDLFEYLRENAEKFIKTATDSAVGSLTKAQNDINNAQQKVNGIRPKIDEARAVVENERRAAINKLQSARSELTKAQNNVNSLQWQIDQAKNQIRAYENEINWWNYWYNSSRWYQKTYRCAQLSAEVAWRGTAIAGLYATIGGLETAKLAATGALEAAKLVLRGLEAVVNTPVDLDPRVAALLTAYAAATGALSVASSALELLKKALGSMASVATFIINAGLGGILDIRRAEFEGLLSLSSGAKISMRIDLTFMNGPVQTYQLDFDFKNPISAVESLFKRALPAG